MILLYTIYVTEYNHKSDTIILIIIITTIIITITIMVIIMVIIMVYLTDPLGGYIICNLK